MTSQDRATLVNLVVTDSDMRRTLLLSMLMLAQPALAGDLRGGFDARDEIGWSGAYAGVFAGLAASSGRAALSDYSGMILPADVAYGLFPQAIKDNRTKPFAGAMAGFNVQSGPFVGGVEADIGYAWTKAHHTFSRLDDTHVIAPFDINTDTRYETDFGLLATLRARGGYAFGNTLLFATAGLAAGDVANRFALAMPEIGYSSPDWSTSGLRLGYALGAGLEHRLNEGVSVRFETLYVNLADRVIEATDPAAFPGESISYRFANDIVIPRLGVNVKF